MVKLFIENFESVNTDEKLKKLQEKYSGYDPAYITQAAGIPRKHIKEWLEELWEQYEPYADKDFSEKLKKEFHQRTWEMYLACTLLNRGFLLKEIKTKKGGEPDICLELNGKNIWLEAIAPRVGEGNDRIPEIQYGVVQDVPEEQMLLRLRNALEVKFNKYKDYLGKNIIKENEAYIIAINKGALLHPDPQIPLILKCLFSIGFLGIPIRSEKSRTPFWSRREELKKKSGSSISMGFFENPEYSCISAVVYCVDNILNSPRDKNTMGDNFVFVLNPLAKNRIEEKLFGFGQVWKKDNDKVINLRN